MTGWVRSLQQGDSQVQMEIGEEIRERGTQVKHVIFGVLEPCVTLMMSFSVGSLRSAHTRPLTLLPIETLCPIATECSGSRCQPRPWRTAVWAHGEQLEEAGGVPRWRHSTWPPVQMALDIYLDGWGRLRFPSTWPYHHLRWRTLCQAGTPPDDDSGPERLSLTKICEAKKDHTISL